MHAATDHQITSNGNDRMSLLDEESKPVAVARRQEGVWNLSADGVEDGVATTRDEAIQKLTEHTLLSIKGSLDVEGFSTFVPHAVRNLP